MTYHLSLPIGVPRQSSPLSNLIEQDTPLTSNLSELSKNVRSRQLQRINVGDPKSTILQKSSFDDEGVHPELGTAVINSSKISPVNLEMSFAAEEESKEKLDCPGSPGASNEGLYKPPKNLKAKVPVLHNKSRKQYSVADHGPREILPSIIGNSVGGDLLTSSSCFLVWNVPHVVFHMKNLSFQLVKNHTPMCVQTQMSGLMVTISPPLHLWCVTIIIPRPQQLQSMLGRMCLIFLM
jgi:hypothetical protein